MAKRIHYTDIRAPSAHNYSRQEVERAQRPTSKRNVDLFAMYESCGNAAAVARVFGISANRVAQIVYDIKRRRYIATLTAAQPTDCYYHVVWCARKNPSEVRDNHIKAKTFEDVYMWWFTHHSTEIHFSTDEHGTGCETRWYDLTSIINIDTGEIFQGPYIV